MNYQNVFLVFEFSRFSMINDRFPDKIIQFQKLFGNPES